MKDGGKDGLENITIYLLAWKFCWFIGKFWFKLSEA